MAQIPWTVGRDGTLFLVNTTKTQLLPSSLFEKELVRHLRPMVTKGYLSHYPPQTGHHLVGWIFIWQDCTIPSPRCTIDWLFAKWKVCCDVELWTLYFRGRRSSCKRKKGVGEGVMDGLEWAVMNLFLSLCFGSPPRFDGGMNVSA